MVNPGVFTFIALLLHTQTLAIAVQNCYRTKRPSKRLTCVLPTLLQMRDTLCSTDQNWGEGFRFLSGHGVVLRVRDNCTADALPEGAYADFSMTISSTVKDREDCWKRTKAIIETCVNRDGDGDGEMGFSGGEWWDTDADADEVGGPPGQTFIWMQWNRIEAPVPPDPCYEYPPPEYCGMS